MRKVLLLFLSSIYSLALVAQINPPADDGVFDDPGDIAFVSVATTPPAFSFLLFDDMADGTTIFFTDSDWRPAQTDFGMNPGYLTWTNNTGATIPRGTLINVTNADNSGTGIAVNFGIITRSNSFTIPNNKFIIFALSDNPAVANYMGSFLAAIAEETSATLTGTSLMEGTHAVTVEIIGGMDDLVSYTGSANCDGLTREQCLMQINNPSNWSDESDGGSFPPAVLPVELIQFTGQARNDMIKIEWATSVEINNDYFQLERSKDGFDFTVIGRVNGQGSTTELTRYSYEDEAPLEGLNYYRLAQYDIDGSREYSDVIVVSMGQVSNGLSNFYPNPANEGLTQVNYFSDKDTPLVIRLQDMSGRVIETFRRDLIRGNNTLSFNLKDQHSGVYVVTFEDGNGIKKTKRLVIK